MERSTVTKLNNKIEQLLGEKQNALEQQSKAEETNCCENPEAGYDRFQKASERKFYVTLVDEEGKLRIAASEIRSVRRERGCLEA